MLIRGIVLIAFLLAQRSNAQDYFYSEKWLEPAVLLEGGMMVGSMNCLTDLGGNNGSRKIFIKDINWKNSQVCFGAYASALLFHKIGLRLEWSYGQVTAADSLLRHDGMASGRYNRNLHFRSGIKEWILAAEIYPGIVSNELMTFRLAPYVIAGLGMFRFNPQARLNNRWYDLHLLCTEGQGFPHTSLARYKLRQVNFPIGLGFRGDLSRLVALRLEVLHRVLLTDYLDDVSTNYVDPVLFQFNLQPAAAAIAEQLADQRRDSNGINFTPGQRGGDKNDSYFSIHLKIGVVLNRCRRT